jgi:small-conductance mechanosensitive channel
MDELHDLINGLWTVLRQIALTFTSIWLPIQFGLILLAALLAFGAGALIRRRTDLTSLTMGWPPYLRLLARAIAGQLGTIIVILLLVCIRAAMQAATLPSRSYLIAVAISLATAWVVITVAASVIRNPFVSRLVAISAWTIAALSILGLLHPVEESLDSVGLVAGGLRITPLLLLKTTALLLIALWAAVSASNFLDLRVRAVADLTPSIQVLLSKLIHAALIIFAVVIVASSAGIDLSAFAIFSGAVGVGIGFGLQKIVSNLLCGIILLADKSIKPGDVISVGDSFGWVTTMGARYTAVVSRDGREFLIPNEDFVTTRVINWSYSKDDVRFSVDFGVDVVADPHQVRRIAVAAAASVPRVLRDPAPVCHFMNFGAKSLDFSLRFWINDPVEGATNVKSAVLLALWDALKRENIPIPPPVQDMRIVAPVETVNHARPPA